MKTFAFLLLSVIFSISTAGAMPASSTIFPTVVGSERLLTDDETAPELCTIQIKGTYDGKEINITVTVTADNCARAAGELLKSFAKK